MLRRYQPNKMTIKYELKCPECGVTTEVDKPDTQRKCFTNHDGVLMKRVYGVAGVHFKGPGFYKTDNK